MLKDAEELATYFMSNPGAVVFDKVDTSEPALSEADRCPSAANRGSMPQPISIARAPCLRVYLRAFESKFVHTCLSKTESAWQQGKSPMTISTFRLQFFRPSPPGTAHELIRSTGRLVSTWRPSGQYARGRPPAVPFARVFVAHLFGK